MTFQILFHRVRANVLQRNRVVLSAASSSTSSARLMTKSHGQGLLRTHEKWRGFGTGGFKNKNMKEKAGQLDRLEENLSALEDEQFMKNVLNDDDDEPLDVFSDEYDSKSQAFQKSRDMQTLATEHDEVTGKSTAVVYEVKDPWSVSEDDIALNLQLEDLPEWSMDTVSETTKERLVLYTDNASNDKQNIHVPTLSTLADMNLPLPAPPLPSDNKKEYNRYRKNAEKRLMMTAVEKLVEVRVEKILRMESENEKQEAVDDLFENIENELYENIPELGLLYKGHPRSEGLIQKSLTDYLIAIKRREENRYSSEQENHQKQIDDESVEEEKLDTNIRKQDAEAVPIFMDLKNEGVKSIFATTGVSGGISEDWELAADEDCKRIMIREPMRRIAQAFVQGEKSKEPARVLITGKKGVGKVIN